MSRPLIALDARITRHVSTGMKRYVGQLVKRLPAAAPDLEFAVIDDGELDASNASWGEWVTLPRLIERKGATLAHYMTIYAPRWSKTPYVYTVHDLIHRRFPGHASWKIPPYYALLVGPVARNARAVITDARATVGDLATYLGVKGDSVRVVPLGVDGLYLLDDEGRRLRGGRARERFGLSRPFFVYAGNHRRHKNLETLAAAWQRTDFACDLVITEDGPFAFDIDRYAKADGRIVRLGYIAEDVLVDLYAGCTGSVQPALSEGFGLAVIESMAAGAPVVIADTPALVEVAAEAALRFHPLDAESLARELSRLYRDEALCERLRAAGRARAAQYSWDATARLTADVYREALSFA